MVFRIDGMETDADDGTSQAERQFPILSLIASGLRDPEDQGTGAAPAHVRRLGAGVGDRELIRQRSAGGDDDDAADAGLSHPELDAVDEHHAVAGDLVALVVLAAGVPGREAAQRATAL